MTESVVASFVGWVYRRREPWRSWGEQVRHLALGLGIERGTGVAWSPREGVGAVLVDLAVMAAGGVSVFDDGRADLVVATDPAGLAPLLDEGAAIDESEPDAFERGWQAIGPDDPATLIERLMVTHGALASAVQSLTVALRVGAHDRVLVGAPPSDATARTAGVLLAAVIGAELCVTSSADFAHALHDWRPTVALAEAAAWEGADTDACRWPLLLASAPMEGPVDAPLHTLWGPPETASVALFDNHPLPGFVVFQDSGRLRLRGPDGTLADLPERTTPRSVSTVTNRGN